MISHPATSKRVVNLSVKKLAVTAGVWLVLGSIGGWLAVAISGEHGSIAFLMIGVAVGVAGALSQCVLQLFIWFRHSKLSSQILIAWAGSLLALLVAAVWSAALSNRLFPLAFSEALSVVVLYCAIPALAVAAIAARLARNAA